MSPGLDMIMGDESPGVKTDKVCPGLLPPLHVGRAHGSVPTPPSAAETCTVGKQALLSHL